MDPVDPPALDYASPPPPRSHPGPWMVVCGGLGWALTLLGGLGVLAHAAMFIAIWYLAIPFPEKERSLRLCTAAGCVVLVGAGIWLLRKRYERH